MPVHYALALGCLDVPYWWWLRGPIPRSACRKLENGPRCSQRHLPLDDEPRARRQNESSSTCCWLRNGRLWHSLLCYWALLGLSLSA